MPTVRAVQPVDLVLALTSRLAEDYDAVPLPQVAGTVRAAVDAVRLFGEDLPESLATVERLSREDLAVLQATALEQASPEPVPEAVAG